ncbi:MAG: FKBP-type peptidyl-prolyl cis-trans isomerase [Paludibacteraceae bacterium]|jgi:FKBP-type peptidyl-prolyl cis-trans isomerase SlyD|nr:FKBP-type peptidyl-prolyl cis-trans isomerase [Paludibacteraceae bacterium]
MDNKTNKYVAVSYKLYTKDENGRHLVEETREGQPFSFISGFGFALDMFEEIVSKTAKGEEFSFTLVPEQAYGDYHKDYVLDLDREVFSINGHFDHEHIYKDAIVPLQNEEGHRFNGRVVEVGEEKVKVDLNHPLAGETLMFEGEVLENRDATKEEIDHLIKHMTGGCGCGCDDCGGGCGDGGCEGGCDHEHHHHEDGCGCGHCH